MKVAIPSLAIAAALVATIAAAVIVLTGGVQ
jgi:hypothetical protein